MVNFQKLENRAVLYSRYLTVFAVVGSLASSVLLFCFGLLKILEAFTFGARYGEQAPAIDGREIPYEAISVISVIEALDNFLIAIVLLYFSYGVYSLFIRPEWQESARSLPEWLRVKQIGQLKQVVAEVIIVILFVLFLRMALTVFQDPTLFELSWMQGLTFLLLPVATALLSLSLRLVELHPKARPRSGSLEEAPDAGGEDQTTLPKAGERPGRSSSA